MRRRFYSYYSQTRPIKEGFNQIRPHSIRSLQFDEKVGPLCFRPEKFDLFTATRIGAEELWSLDLAAEKGSSCWLNVLPIKRYLFNLNESEFREANALTYGWEPRHRPAIRPCGQMLSVSHAFHCPKGDYTHMIHETIRDTFAERMNEVCYNVEIKQYLQSLQGESLHHRTTTTEDEARLYIKEIEVWGTRFSKIYFDVKIFNPSAKSCLESIPDASTFHEFQKRLKYEQRIIKVGNSNVNPFIFAYTGGAGPTATRVMKRLAAKFYEHKDASNADGIAYIRTELSFALLRSTIICIRECRSTKICPNQFVDSTIDAIIEAKRLS